MLQGEGVRVCWQGGGGVSGYCCFISAGCMPPRANPASSPQRLMLVLRLPMVVMPPGQSSLLGVSTPVVFDRV